MLTQSACTCTFDDGTFGIVICGIGTLTLAHLVLACLCGPYLVQLCLREVVQAVQQGAYKVCVLQQLAGMALGQAQQHCKGCADLPSLPRPQVPLQPS